MLVHGAGAHAHWWDVLVPALSPGRRLIAPDLRGHGESDWALPPRYLIEDFAADLLELLRGIAAPPLTLIGHSMGGRVSAWIAARHPDLVRGLVLIDTRIGGLRRDRVEKWRGTSARAPRRAAHPTRDAALASFRLTPPEPGIAPAVRDDLAHHAVRRLDSGDWALRFDRAVLSLDGSRVADLSSLLEDIRCPTLVLRGSESTVISEKHGVETLARLRQGRLLVFPGGHHFLLSHPRQVGEALVDFLEEAASR